jgi:hypothetical protein
LGASHFFLGGSLNNDIHTRGAALLHLLLTCTKKELEVLASEQPQVAGQTFAVEIIPYEDLWEMMVAV